MNIYVTFPMNADNWKKVIMQALEFVIVEDEGVETFKVSYMTIADYNSMVERLEGLVEFKVERIECDTATEYAKACALFSESNVTIIKNN